MKNTFLYLIMISLFFSCDKLEDERFEKLVIFTRNGFQERELSINDEGLVKTNISASISGTDILSKDVDIRISLDKDALQEYNFEKFRNDSSIYYVSLPADSYQIEDNIKIEAGDEYGIVPLTIDIKNMDMYQNYVLPLSISSVSDFEIGSKENSTLLLSLIFKNFFSGTYPMNMKFYDHLENVETNISLNRVLRAVDNQTCYLYAGNISESNADKSLYTIRININEDGTLNLEATNPEIQFEAEPSNIEEKINVAFITEESITIHLNYSYLDISIPEYTVKKTINSVLTKNELVE